jgi:hypothetical protein
MRGSGPERDVAVLLRRVLVALGLEPRQRGDEPRARLPRPDDLVDEPARRRDVGIGELLPELLDALRALYGRIRGGLDLARG